MRHRISPATCIASVALFFSLTGAGVAATGYRITSIWQISPKVRHALRGERGPQGPAGPTGAQGVAGTPGAQGPAGAPAPVTFTMQSTITLTPTDPKGITSLTCAKGMIVDTGYSVTGSVVVIPIPVNSKQWAISADLGPAPQAPGTATAWVSCT